MKKMSPTTIHVQLPVELNKKLDEMSKADRREKTKFVRLLIEDEYDRRKKVAEGNGAQS